VLVLKRSGVAEVVEMTREMEMTMEMEMSWSEPWFG